MHDGYGLGLYEPDPQGPWGMAASTGDTCPWPDACPLQTDERGTPSFTVQAPEPSIGVWLDDDTLLIDVGTV